MSNNSSIWFGSCGEFYYFKCVNDRRSFTSWRMLRTIIARLWGLRLVCNKILLLLSEKRIPKDSGGLTSIPFGKVFYAFLKMWTMPGHMIFSIKFAGISGRFIFFLISRCSGLLFWVWLFCWLLLRRSDLFLILLVLATGFLCRLHRVYHSGRKSNWFGRGVHRHLGDVTAELFYSGPRGCTDNPVGMHSEVLSSRNIRVTKGIGDYVVNSARLWIYQI